MRFTRQSKKSAEDPQNKSAITDHVARENHVIDVESVKVVGQPGPGGSMRPQLFISVKDRPRTGIVDLTFLLLSTYDKLLRRDPAHLHGNDTWWRRVETHSDEGVGRRRKVNIPI